MPRYVAFLRAVNVGGASTVKMGALCSAFEEMGFSNVHSFIASGNIIFNSAARSTGQMERKIERGLLQTFGREFTPFVRTIGELAEIVAFAPFPQNEIRAGDQLAVLFLSEPPDAGAEQMLESSDPRSHQFRVRGREVYWLRHGSAEDGVYSTVPLDRALSEPFTIRTMNTLKRLAQKYGSDPHARRAS